MSAPFCASCNRARLTADGVLRLCLLRDKEVNLLKPLRARRERSRNQADHPRRHLEQAVGSWPGGRRDPAQARDEPNRRVISPARDAAANFASSERTTVRSFNYCPSACPRRSRRSRRPRRSRPSPSAPASGFASGRR